MLLSMLRRPRLRPAFIFTSFTIGSSVLSNNPFRERIIRGRKDAERLRIPFQSMSQTDPQSYPQSSRRRTSLKRPFDLTMDPSDQFRGRPDHESSSYVPQNQDSNARQHWRPRHDRWHPQPRMNPQVDRGAFQQPAHPSPQSNTAGRSSCGPRRPPNWGRETEFLGTPPVYYDQSYPVSNNNATLEASLPFVPQNVQNAANTPNTLNTSRLATSNFGMGVPFFPNFNPGPFSAMTNNFPNALPYQQNFYSHAQYPTNLGYAGNPMFWNNAMYQMNFMSTMASLMNTSTEQMAWTSEASLSNTVPPGAVNASHTETPGKNDPKHREHTSRRSPTPTVAPVPTEEYLAQAALKSKRLSSPQPLLVILDLNGTLLHRLRHNLPPTFVRRPGLHNFLKQLFKNYHVMIWSSMQPENVKTACNRLLRDGYRRQLVTVWARDKLGLTKSQYREKVQVYKRLEAVWADESIQDQYPKSKRKLGKEWYKTLILDKQPSAEESETSEDLRDEEIEDDSHAPVLPSNLRWDQSNTVLIDDSKLKAVSQPYNILEIPEFTNDSSRDETEVLKMVLKRLKVLSRTDDVSRMLRFWDKANMTVTQGMAARVAKERSKEDAMKQEQEKEKALAEPCKKAKKAQKKVNKAARRLVYDEWREDLCDQTTADTPQEILMDSK